MTAREHTTHAIGAATLALALASGGGAPPVASAVPICNPQLLCPGAAAACVVTGRWEIATGCVLDLAGRDVTLANNATLDIDGGNVTLLVRRLVVATGALIDGRPEGGTIAVRASGDIEVQRSVARGVDVGGDSRGGTIDLDAGGDLRVDGRLKANNAASAAVASGGSVQLRAGGDVVITAASDVDASGGGAASGGSIDIAAGKTVRIEHDVTANGLDGGSMTLNAGLDVMLAGRLLANAANGGDGDTIEITAGRNVEIAAAVESTGGSTSTESGMGGEISVTAIAGHVVVRADMTARGGVIDGPGGEIVLSGEFVTVQAGKLDVNGGRAFSCAGSVGIDAGTDLAIAGRIEAYGAEEGGTVDLAAGRHVTIGGAIMASSQSPGSDASNAVDVRAGVRDGGNLTVSGRIDVSAAPCSEGFCSSAGDVQLTGCDVTVAVTGVLDASAPGEDGFAGQIGLTAHRRLRIDGTIDAVDALGAGGVALIYPSARPPVVPGRVAPPASVTSCSVARCGERACRALCTQLCDCGNATVEQFEECDDGAGACAAGCGAPGTALECLCIDTCGNGRIDPGEDCDGGVGAETCASRGLSLDGTLACTACRFDERGCRPRCGDGLVATRIGELCEANDLGGNTCVTAGFVGGDLACGATCRFFDTRACRIGICGDGAIDPGEQCDHGPFNSDAPNAGCRPDCTPARCGDGIRDDARDEQCDDGNLDPADACLEDCIAATCGDGILCTAPDCATGPGGGPEECDAQGLCCLSTCGIRRCADGLACGDAGDNGCCHPDARCDDADVCTADTCDLTRGCAHTAIAGCCRGAGACDDRDDCTADACDGTTARCTHAPITECCRADAECADADACTTNRCDPATDRCVSASVSCESTDACLLPAGCDAAVGCLFVRPVGSHGLGCLVTHEVAALSGAVDTQASALGAKLAQQLKKHVATTIKRIEKAQAKLANPPKAAVQLTKADAQISALVKKVTKRRDQGKLDAAVAADLLNKAAVAREVLSRAIREVVTS